jgi:hypothetical protein
MSASRAPPAVSPDDGGSERVPEGHVRTRLPRAPAGRIGFSDAKQGARSASPMSFGSRGLSRRSRRDSGRVNNSDRDAPHLCPRPSPSCSVESTRPEWRSLRNSPQPRGVFVTRYGRSSGVQPTFQRTSTRASHGLPSSGFSPRLGECRVHGASLASDHQGLRGEAACCSNSASEPAFL